MLKYVIDLYKVRYAMFTSVVNEGGSMSSVQER